MTVDRHVGCCSSGSNECHGGVVRAVFGVIACAPATEHAALSAPAPARVIESFAAVAVKPLLPAAAQRRRRQPCMGDTHLV